MKCFFRLLHWPFLCLLSSVAVGQSLVDEDMSSFARFTTEHGLADNWVHVAMRDQLGFLWFGTEGGLSRFDGQQFLNFYEEKDSQSTLSNNSVTDIIEDADGNFWMSVLDGGLNHFDPASGKFEYWKTDTRNPEIGGLPISLISVLQDGELLWLGSYHHGLGCFNKKERRYVGWHTLREDSLKSSNSFQYNTVKHAITDNNDPNILWLAAAGRGLGRFDKILKKFEFIEIKDKQGVGGVAAMRLSQDADGIIWIATWSAGIASFDPKSKTMKTFPFDLPSWLNFDSNRNVVVTVQEKNRNELWVATDDHDFGVFDKKTGRYRFFNRTLSGESPELDRRCQGLFVEDEQKLWVLGVRGGIRAYDLDNQSMQYISLVSVGTKTERAEVTAFTFEPSRNAVFIATENAGCFQWSGKDNSLVQFAKPLPGAIYPDFRALAADRTGNVWAGASKNLVGGASLYLLKPGQSFFEPAQMPPFNNKVEQTINDILLDAKGNIWIATSYDGLYKIAPDRRKVIHYNDKIGFPPGAPTFQPWWAFLDIQEDSNGHLWLALKSGGVLNFDPTTARFVKYDNNNVLNSNDSRAVEIGADGSIWVGTNSSGLEIFAVGSQSIRPTQIIRKGEGLPGDHISAIKKDEENNLWMATNQGLVVYNPVGEGSFRVFGKSEGLKTPYLKGKGLEVVPNLGVLVGQPNGFCLLRSPNRKSTTTSMPRVVLTDFKIYYQSKYFDKNIRNATEVELKPSENAFAFEFGIPTSLDADLASYQFKLDGFDEKWYTADGGKSVNYTGLSPGNYTFRVKLAGGEETQLNICILPYWWQAKWFWVLVVLAGALGVTGLVRYRTSQIRHEEQLKTAFYKELSDKEMTALRSQMNPHFIFNCLNSINNFIVRNDSEQAANYVTKFSRLIRLVLENSRSPKVSLEKELEALRLYMDLEAMRFGGKFRYEIWVEDEVDEQYVQIPPLLMQPYVENAIWHGLLHKPEGGSVVVDVRQPSDSLLHVEITDDGVGRERAASLESKEALTHKPQGTLITAERLRMLKLDKPNTGCATFQDLIDAEGMPCGTKVILKIPI